MASRFVSPGVDRLTEVDRADCEYNPSVVEIEGVVSPSDQGGWPHSDAYAVHCFSFSAWRRLRQPLIKNELTILRPVDPDGDWFFEYPKLTVHRIRVLLSTDDSRAIFAGKSKDVADTKGLLVVIEELKKPVIIATERFGDLTLDRSIGWFEGNVRWNGELVHVTFSPDDNQNINKGLATAEKLWSEQQAWKEKVGSYAVKKLLPLKNDYWLGDGESPLNTDEFISRMTLQSISILPDGDFEFWHDDGDLFGGHFIQISGSLDDGLTDADIPG